MREAALLTNRLQLDEVATGRGVDVLRRARRPPSSANDKPLVLDPQLMACAGLAGADASRSCSTRSLPATAPVSGAGQLPINHIEQGACARRRF